MDDDVDRRQRINVVGGLFSVSRCRQRDRGRLPRTRVDSVGEAWRNVAEPEQQLKWLEIEINSIQFNSHTQLRRQYDINKLEYINLAALMVPTV